MITCLRIVASFTLALLVTMPAAAQSEVTERFSKTAHLDPNGTFDLGNISGNIVIAGASGRDVVIDAIKRVQRPNPRAARALLQVIDIQVIEQANRVEVRTSYPRPRNFPGSVDFTVMVPEDANVIVKTMTGNVRATNIKGELRAETVSGNLMVSGIRKLEALKGVSGDIDINDAAADDLVTASTVSGNISVRGLKAKAIQLASVSGNIRVDDSQAERMMMRAVDGSIDYTGDLSRNGRYDLRSHSGDIRLVLSGSTGFELQASSFSGTVRSDFAVNRRRPRGEEGRAAGPGEGARAVRGAVGDASAMLAVRAFSGNISIARR